MLKDIQKLTSSTSLALSGMFVTPFAPLRKGREVFEIAIGSEWLKKVIYSLATLITTKEISKREKKSKTYLM
jgi:hypothetical protein